MPLNQVPFEFPGNRERFGDLVLPDELVLIQLLSGNQRVLVVAFSGTFDHFQHAVADQTLRLVARAGQWELISTR